MHNVAPSRALTRRSRELLSIAFVVGAIGAFVAVVALAMFFIQIIAATSPSYGLYTLVRGLLLAIGLIALVVAVVIAARALTLRTDNDLALVTGRFLEQQLDNRFHFIRNVNKTNLGYIDAVLVGPPGVLIFRIMNTPGVLANEGADWMRQDRRGLWLPAGIEPTREAVEDIRKMREYLAAHNLGEPPVFGVVVFTRDENVTRLMLRNPVVPVTHLHLLMQALSGNYMAKERIDAAHVNGIIRVLYDT